MLSLRERMPFHFIKLRRIWYIFSAVLVIPGLIFLFSQGLHLGIDFTGGNLMDLRFSQATSVEQVRGVLSGSGLGDSHIQQSGDTDFIIRTGELSEEQSANLVQALETNFGEFTILRNERVGPTIGRELLNKALGALVVASVLMIIYISWRFEFKQGLAAVLGLIHNVLVVLGFFSIFQLEVDSAFVAAILTIIGYSINDTIVIFDRIRENMLNKKKGDLLENVINASLWQTLARSINTVLTVVMILVAMLLFGGTTIHNMVLALLIGIVCGAYTSICIASPLWYEMKKLENRPKTKAARA